MDKEFLQLFMDRTDYPQEARIALLHSADTLMATGQGDLLLDTVEFFFENHFSIELVEPRIAKMAEKSSLSPYTVWMLMLIEASQKTRKVYKNKGKPDELFWNTFADLRYKAVECKANHDVWGTFVAFWYPIFYSCEIVKLGRLEYQDCTYSLDEPYTRNGYTVKKGDQVKSIHIPSSGEPFDEAARLESYKLAYEYFKEELDGKPLVCLCHSWLLYPEYSKLLGESSNITSFQRDFDIIKWEKTEQFGDAWRLYGPEHINPTAELPERTTMQRAVKKHLLSGGKAGEGIGILLFDGEKIVNR